MARNKSEKLPSCPSAWEYIQAVEALSLLEEDRDCTAGAMEAAENRIAIAWRRMGTPLRREANKHIRHTTGAGLYSTLQPKRRKMRAAYFKEHYGA